MKIDIIEEDRRYHIPFVVMFDDGTPPYRSALNLSHTEFSGMSAPQRRNMMREQAMNWHREVTKQPEPETEETRKERRVAARRARAEALRAAADAEDILADLDPDDPDDDDI